jgi:hypothetical protein
MAETGAQSAPRVARGRGSSRRLSLSSTKQHCRPRLLLVVLSGHQISGPVGSRSQWQSTSGAPTWANTWAVASPMPELAPGTRATSTSDASDASLCAFNRDVKSSLWRSIASISPSNLPIRTMPFQSDVAVVEDEVAIWGPIADVSDHRVVSLRRTVERHLAGKRSDLFHVVEVAKGERQRQLTGEIACGRAVVQR